MATISVTKWRKEVSGKFNESFSYIFFLPVWDLLSFILQKAI